MRCKYVVILIIAFVFSDAFLLTLPCDAFLFHATRKAAAKRIMKKGFSRAKMRSTARFGKGVYTSTKKKTALKEAGTSNAILKFNKSNYLKKNTINLTNPTPAKLRKQINTNDLRGAVKNKVIGPKLGKKLGGAAAKKGEAIRYRSAKDLKGSNVFIPEKVYKRHPKILGAQK